MQAEMQARKQLYAKRAKGGLFFMAGNEDNFANTERNETEIEVIEDFSIEEVDKIEIEDAIDGFDGKSELEECAKPKKKSKITYLAVHGEKGIRKKFKDGVFQSYEVTISYGRQEVYDEKLKIHRKKEIQERKTFYNLDDAIQWRNSNQSRKIEAKQKKVTYQKQGAKFMDAAEAYYQEMEKMVQKGKKAESYLEQLRIQTDHFRKFFNGERTTYVKSIDTKQIEDYFLFEEENGAAKASITKYKSHLKAIWKYMLKDRATYGVTENVVVNAEITAPKSKYKAVALNYKQITELIQEACKLDDPTFLYMVVFSMTQGLRRGELCGLMWKDIDFVMNRVTICHNRVQLSTKDTTKLPKRDKVREIELHKLGSDTIRLYKEWQESILGRGVRPDEFVMQWEINLLQQYNCHTGKVSRKWKEIFTRINKAREKEKKELIPYGRLHDGRHTYITLALQGVRKDDGTIVSPASFFQVFQSAGHSLPKSMQNTSTTVYNEDVGDRWDVTRFWNDVIEIDVAETWKSEQIRRKVEYSKLSDAEKDKLRVRKEKRLEKAKNERLNSETTLDILQEYE